MPSHQNASDQKSAPLGRRRGPKPTFDRSDVIAEVLRHDLSTVSISGIARELEVAPSALYRVVKDREELITLALQHIAAEVTIPTDSNNWPDVLRTISSVFWETLEKYPGLAAVVLTQPGMYLHLEPLSRACMTQLCCHGLSPEQAEFALDFVGDTVLANHLAVDSYRNGGLERVRQRLADGEYSSPEDPTPPVINPDESWIDQGILSQKIECIIAGLENHTTLTT